MKPIVVRTTQFTVLPEGDPIFSEAATTVTIKDDAAGEYLVVEQLGRDEQGRIYIEPGQWERVRSAIDVLISECRKDEENDS